MICAIYESLFNEYWLLWEPFQNIFAITSILSSLFSYYFILILFRNVSDRKTKTFPFSVFFFNPVVYTAISYIYPPKEYSLDKNQKNLVISSCMWLYTGPHYVYICFHIQCTYLWNLFVIYEPKGNNTATKDNFFCAVYMFIAC